VKDARRIAFNSFHPTMVLAQHEQRMVYVNPSSSFHPTMVLAQPDLSEQAIDLAYKVSIPLWFSLNYLGRERDIDMPPKVRQV